MSQPVHTSSSEPKMSPARLAAAVAASRPARPSAARKATSAKQPISEATQLAVTDLVLTPEILPGIEISLEMINPELAELYLSRLPTALSKIKQRNLSPKTAQRYAGDMAAERWTFTGDPIRFNSAGELIDGQHRLRGIVNSGQAQPMMVIRGLDPEAFVVLDTGRGRSFSDVLKSMGVANTSMVAGVTRRVFYWIRGGYGVPSVRRVHNAPFLGVPASPGLMLEAFLSNREEIQGAGRRGATFKQNSEFATKTAPPSLVGFVYLLLRRIDKDGCQQFFNELQFGPEQVGPEYPIAGLRKRLLKRVGAGTEPAPDWVWMHFFLRTWNAWQRGESMGPLKTPAAPEVAYLAQPYDPHAGDRDEGWEPIPLMRLQATPESQA